MPQGPAREVGDGGTRQTPEAPHEGVAEVRIERALTDELAAIQTTEAAEEVAGRIDQMAGSVSAGEAAEYAAAVPGDAADAVETAETTHSGSDCSAAVLTEAAAQVVAPTPEAPDVAEAAGVVLPPGEDGPSPEARRGRRLLRDAMLRRMGPWQRLDTRLFLAVNGLPHPLAANVLADAVTVVTTGGWIWLLGLAAARMAGVQDSQRAFRLAAPCVLGATSVVEWPIKSVFRRQRPFIDVVRAMVIGRRPDGWSFPSGHTAAAFSGAWIVSTVWPKRAPIFFALASCVGFSRIYVGAHYPGDVFFGATLGMLLAELIRRPVSRCIR